ncbi:MAG: hypothetical protein LLG02_07160 [Pelosinus sp.]|nr:hypothetical protein [Pelosinus sp.]
MQYHMLKNDKTGKTIRVRFRPFEDKDAPEFIRCIYSEYGDTYFKRSFYQAATLIKENASGHIRFLTAQLDNGEIAGMLALKRFLPREDMCEIASEIFKQEYRGYHMSWPFFQYSMEIMDTLKVSAAYCLPVVFHEISEVLMERLGLIPCGFIFSVFLMQNIRHSYSRDHNLKHPQGVMVQMKEKKDAGVLFLPAVHQDFAAKLYNDLGAKVSFGRGQAELYGKSQLFFENDSVQQNCAIHVDYAGSDLATRILEIRAAHVAPYQTFNVFLNVSDKSAPAAYHALLRLGYFFTGFQPLCSKREIMILHDPQRVPLYVDTFKLTERFTEVLDYIRLFYQVRRCG